MRILFVASVLCLSAYAVDPVEIIEDVQKESAGPNKQWKHKNKPWKNNKPGKHNNKPGKKGKPGNGKPWKGKNNGNKVQHKQKDRKEFRKLFHACVKQHCPRLCSQGQYKEPECVACFTSNCDAPKRLDKAIDCIENICKDDCAGKIDSHECKECKIAKCLPARRPKGVSPKNPLRMLDKYVCGRPKGCYTIENGAKARHRCALGMCYKQCLLEPINELDCERCVNSLCSNASDNYSCIGAEKDHKYFFCSTAENCTGAESGGVPVPDKDCPDGSTCCSWGE